MLPSVRRDLLRGLLSRVVEGQRPMGMYQQIDSPELVEIAAAIGVEWIMVSCEHSAVADKRSLYHIARACDAAAIPFFVKLNSLDPARVTEVLDMGASGIAAPFVDTAADLKRLAEMTRIGGGGGRSGIRGFCSVNRSLAWGAEYVSADFRRYGEYFKFAKEVLTIPFIESKTALENIDELLAVPDVPVYAIGAADLSLSLSTDGTQDFEAVHEAEIHIGERARKHGKFVMNLHHHTSWPSPSLQVPYVPDDAAAAARLKDKNIAMPFVVDAWALASGLKAALNTLGRSLASKR